MLDVAPGIFHFPWGHQAQGILATFVVVVAMLSKAQAGPVVLPPVGSFCTGQIVKQLVVLVHSGTPSRLEFGTPHATLRLFFVVFDNRRMQFTVRKVWAPSFVRSKATFCWPLAATNSWLLGAKLPTPIVLVGGDLGGQ